jgi:hypothetical protein
MSAEWMKSPSEWFDVIDGARLVRADQHCAPQGEKKSGNLKSVDLFF